MKKILSILLVFLAALSSYAQTEAGFLKDAKNNFVRVGISSTEFRWSAFPPDTIIDFSVNVGGVGEPFTSLNTELKAYYSLEDVSGDAIDSAGTYDLTPHGTISYEQAGKSGDCFSFATDGYLDYALHSFEFSGSFSIALWMRASYVSGDPQYLVTTFGASNYGYDCYMSSGATAYAVGTFRYSGGSVYMTGGPQINDDVWHHLVYSYSEDDDSTKIWVDGNIADKDKMPSAIVYNAGCDFNIGARLSAQYWYFGLLDEVAIYNKELTHEEIDSLHAENVFPFTGQGSGGDSLRMTNNGFDPRGDSVRVLWKYTGWPANRTDGTLQFAFNMADSADYKDTTFVWGGLGDTIVYYAAFTGTDDVWTDVPNKDTVFVDSSDVMPPDQDFPGIWDTIFYNDFEQLSAPIYYDRTTFISEWSPLETVGGQVNWRASDFRSPLWFNENLKDSIVIDETTGSKVLQVLWAAGIHDGYDGQSGRGGDQWMARLDGEPYTEIYFSSNIMLRPGFDWSAGGKLCWGIGGGTDPGSGVTEPEYGDGFLALIQWGWDPNAGLEGNPATYLYYQDSPGTYGQYLPFDDFQPEGPGLTGNYNAQGRFIWPVTDSVWYNITYRCVTNTHTGTTHNHDGILEGFINGKLVLQVSGLYLITYPDIGNEIWLLRWYQSFGGGGAPLRDEWIWNDDFYAFTYDVGVDVPRGNELSSPGRVLSLPNWPKPQPPE